MAPLQACYAPDLMARRLKSTSVPMVTSDLELKRAPTSHVWHIREPKRAAIIVNATHAIMHPISNLVRSRGPPICLLITLLHWASILAEKETLQEASSDLSRYQKSGKMLVAVKFLRLGRRQRLRPPLQTCGDLVLYRGIAIS